jgi:hypothetical protein
MEHLKTSLIDIQNSLALKLYGVTRSDALRRSICLRCKKPARLWGRYKTSGLCEECYSSILITHKN